MKAWVYRKNKKDDHGLHLFLESAPEPSPEPNQVKVKVEKVSVCGTDDWLFKGELARVPDGVIPGHEFYGEIIELGSQVHSGLKVGQKLAAESHYEIPGIHDQGIIGLWGPEVTKGESLPPLNGAYAEYVCIPEECAHPVPGERVGKGFWPSLFEAIGNDYFLTKRTREVPDLHYMGVFGCGPHGVFAQIFARHFGIPKIAAYEIDAVRRKFAQDLDVADHVMDPTSNLLPNVREFTNGGLYDVTLDMVGKQGHAFQSCCETTRDGGTIFLFGLFTDQFSIAGVKGNDIIFKMQTLKYPYKGKELKIVGITGREGIWGELIESVCNNKDLQEHLMRPVRVMGNLSQLGEDSRHLQPEIMKRAYHAFA